VKKGVHNIAFPYKEIFLFGDYCHHLVTIPLLMQSLNCWPSQ